MVSSLSGVLWGGGDAAGGGPAVAAPGGDVVTLPLTTEIDHNTNNRLSF
jgi:hypothetical protein